jgi:hypothetical protein
MATITERLQALGIGVKSDAQKERDASPVLSAMFERRQPTLEEIQEQERLNRAAGVTFPRYQGNLNLSAGEKLRNIGGLTYVVPAAAPIVERNIERRPQSYSSLDTLTGDVREQYIPGVQAQANMGLFDTPTPAVPPPAVPTRPDLTPTRPTAVDPTRETQFGNMQQDVIPVNPNDAIQTLMARLTNYYTDDSPAMPVRRQDVAPVRQAYSPRPEFMQGPGLMTPQLPQPQMPNLDVQAYAPDMFTGQLPMPRPTQYDSDPLGIENIPIQANPLAELPLGTAIDEQGNLINAQTGAIITPNYQPNY